MDNRDEQTKKALTKTLKPAYLDSLSGFAELLGSMERADTAARELLKETSNPPSSPKVKAAAVREREITESDNTPPLEELMAELDKLVGLDNIKKSVKSLINYVKVRKIRELNLLPNAPVSFHMVFMGNPGTGKTTVARILAQLFRAVGVLSKGQLVEVDRAGLVAGYVGQTAIKTGEVIKSALGGVLFIDEAYALTHHGSVNDFGREAVETLLKMMEDERRDLIVIVAGYEELMRKFIDSNPGLKSRFNRWFLFEDYNDKELFAIFERMCTASEYVLDDDARQLVLDHLQKMYEERGENFGNARYVRNFFENMISVHADRLSKLETHTREDLTKVIYQDIEKCRDM